jgi:hypothetical protein
MSESFLNLDDEQRTFLATNFQQLEEGVTEYLVLQGLVPDPSASGARGEDGKARIHISRPVDILRARVEFLGLRVEARHLQRVLMCWSTCSALPSDSSGYQKALQLVREQTLLKVLLERDTLSEQYYAAKEGRRDGAEAGSGRAAAQKLKREKATILESVNLNSREHTVVSAMHHSRAEITVARRVLDSELVRLSLNIIKSEHASLLAAFEQGASETSV